MVDWSKERSLYERILIDKMLPKKSRILYYFVKKEFLRRSAETSIGVLPEDNPQLKIVSVGNSHLDSAWRWRKSDAREKKIEPTFSRSIFHLEENFFPRYTFTANASIHYAWIQEDYPLLFQKIKYYVDLKRWEIVGGDWVEMDVNLPDGESLVRQRLLGQRFYAKNFNKIADIAWYDDVFGFCQMLPQILAKSGAKYMYTNKFCYSDYSIKYSPESPKYVGGEKFPLFHFKWQSPDKSQVILTWAQHKNNFFKHLKHFTEHSRTISQQSSLQQSSLQQSSLRKDKDDKIVFDYWYSWQTIDKVLSDEVIPLIVNAYGHGDGGMGPRPLEILDQSVLDDLGFVEMAPLNKFFKYLKSYEDRLPIWGDELYLENHRGTYTSVAMIKENNHTGEILFQQTESLGVITGTMGLEHVQNELDPYWDRFLFLQFHDILPGSSIVEVYRDAADDYNHIFRFLMSSQEFAIMTLAHTLREKTMKGYYSVYNSLSWSRGGYLTLLKRTYQHAMNENNKPLLTQAVSYSPYVVNREFQLGMDEVPGTNYLIESDGHNQLEKFLNHPNDKLLIYIPSTSESEIESVGLKNIILLEKGKFQKKPPIEPYIEELEKYWVMRNEYITIEISKETGAIISLITHSTSRKYPSSKQNVLKGKGIRLALYKDEKTKFDAWNIDPDFYSKPVEFPRVKNIKIEEKGPIRWTLLIEYEPRKTGTEIFLRLSLYHSSQQIRGEVLINWQEEYKILKWEVETIFDVPELYCGTPYYIQKRALKPTTVYQEAMFEVPFQQFAFWRIKDEFLKDSDKNEPCGCAIYTQTKYGLSPLPGGCGVGVSLLKAPHFIDPDKEYATLDDDFGTRSDIVDLGFHRIPFACEILSPHMDQITILRNAIEYNYPLLASPTFSQHQPYSFINCDRNNVIITAIKEIEKFIPEAPDWFYKPSMAERPFVIRCVEYEGKETDCTLEINKNIFIKRVYEVDLLERINNQSLYQPQQNEDKTVNINKEDNKIKFKISPYEIKSILIIARMPLEDE